VQLPDGCHKNTFLQSVNTMAFLVFGGATGWIGQMLVKLLKDSGKEVYIGKSRLEDRSGLEREIDELKPKYLLNAAGVTGRPNVDWCEDHKVETIRSNVLGTLNLVDVALMKGLAVTVFATGCIYEYDELHPMYSEKGFTEEETPNFSGSFYSMTKGMVEKLLMCYDNVLVLRLRMPLCDELHARNFITKITNYQKVVNIPNSMTELDEMLPIAIDMTVRERKGVYNFTNPGVVSHNEILELYKKHIDPSFVWQNFTVEEQSLILKAGRSNNQLDTTKLQREYPNLTPMKQAVEKLFQRMAKKKEAAHH